MKLSRFISIISSMASKKVSAATLTIIAMMPFASRAIAADLYPLVVSRSGDQISIDLDSVGLTNNGRQVNFVLVQNNSSSTFRRSNGVAGYVMTWWTDCNQASLRETISVAEDWQTVIQIDAEPSSYSVPPSRSVLGQAVSLVCDGGRPRSDYESYLDFLSRYRNNIQY